MIVMLFAPMAVMAQKFGHIDTQRLFQQLPETARIRGELEALTKQYDDQLKKMQDDLVASGGAAYDGKELKTTVDLTFKSASAVTNLVFCTRRNGRETFKDADGKSINDIEGKK